MRMEKIDFYMEYEHTWIDHPLTISVYFDDRLIHLDQGHTHTVVDKKIALHQGKHKLKLVIQNKNEVNTKIDQQGNVLEDTLVTIKELKINDIDLKPIIESHSVYHTQSQGTLKQTLVLGLNGSWELDVNVPIYDWLLEKIF